MKRDKLAAGMLSTILLLLTMAVAQPAVSQTRPEISERSVREFIRTKLDSPGSKAKSADLKLARSFHSMLGSHFVFEQYYRGIPVENGRTAIHFNRNGQIILVEDTYNDRIDLETVEPAVDESIAVKAAKLAIGEDHPLTVVTLVIHQYGGEYRLAWKVDISTNGPTWETYIDAGSGEVLGEPRDINFYIDGTGQIFRDNAVVATGDNTLTDQRDATGAVPSTAYSVAILHGLFGNGYLDGEFASSSSSKKRAFDLSNTFIFDRSYDGFSETMGYFYIDYAERYIQSLGFTNVNARQQIFSVNRYQWDNSFYNPSTKEITYGLGGVDDAEDAEVILHEYGHSIQDNQVLGFGGSLEARSMGEGFGDYFAASVAAQFSGGFQDECFADWDATSYSPFSPHCLRILNSPKHYPEDVIGEVHADGEIWSAALWQIRGAIGAEKSDRAVIASHFLLSPGATFTQGANALITAAINLGYRGGEVRMIRKIMTDRGFAPTM